ncbi:MAG: UDP-4-amino-4,6-dideoxy-N-acetyl-beta-L-altrosamine N-acetyltransferase [Rhodocyclaceae bacterium]|nr:UDP-4-amino-4,6-dideoxy-N-acetyl-beta-L-altrosamine N-acetyltransferase [Rhodocyclaceae bacterium]
MNCTLREINAEDLPMVLEWRNAEDVRNNMYTNHVISIDEHQSWWELQSKNPKTRLLIAELDAIAAGVITFTNYTGLEGVATWAFYSGDRTRRGVGAAMEVAALNYAFDNLQVRKLECEVLDFNMPVIRFHLRHGFRVEGILREAYIRDGKSFDIYRLAMLKRDWLNIIKPTLESRSREASGAQDFTGKKFSHSVCIDSESVRLFAETVKDHNPVHFDDSAAIECGFATRISHGMLTGSLFSSFFASKFPGRGTIYLGQALEFHSPIAVGTTVELKMRVLAHIGRRLLVETQVFDGDLLCVSGQANLLLPKILNQEVAN